MKTTRRSFTKALHHLRGLWKRRKGVSARTARRGFFFEPLESRSLLAGDLASYFSVQGEGEGENTNPTFLAISDQTVLSGAPLWLGIDGSDAEGNPITYTVTSNNPSVVAVTVPTGNKTLVLNVAGFGTMKYQLFDNLAPRAASAIETLANAGFYNGLTFHRILNNFVIQGGAADGAGGPNASVPDFDDQFHPDLQFTSPGLLAMAKGLDDTNDTQFFVTDTVSPPTSNFPRHLDFNHTIFGKLTEGESVREAISNVAANGSGLPNTPVIITSATIVNNDTENGAFMLKALSGSGSADITVTANDGQGGSFSRTFHVTVAPDTSNGSPFLSDIPDVRSTVGSGNISFQLQGNDVEGDAIYYDAVKIGPVNYTVSVDHASGLVTVVPPAGFVGNFQVQVSAKAQSQQNTPDSSQSITDVQKVTVHVAPSAPAAPDLAAASDTGTSSSDNITKSTSLDFTVTNVTSGAVIRLYEGTNVLAQTTASGTTATINFAGIATLGEGVHNFTVTQAVSGEESVKSAPLSVTFDTTAPGGFTTTPPATATAGSLYSYDANNSGDTSGITYSIDPALTGVTINPSSGVVSWTPSDAQVGARTFGIVASDAAGNSVSQTANVTVSAAVVKLAELVLSITNTNQVPITTLHVGDNFILRGSTRDLRADPKGVYAMFADLGFDSSKVQVTGDIQFNGGYTVGSSGTASTNLLDEIGAVSNSTVPINSGLKLLFEVPMKVLAGGQIVFTSEPADLTPSHDVLLFLRDPIVPTEQVKYGTISIGVDTTFNAVNDTFNFNEDTSNNTLNVLTNDTIVPGSGNVLTIDSVGATDHSGTVSISGDAKSLKYTPAPNFSGTETFTYTVKNQANETSTATVTVQVASVNDPPSATADTFSVPGETTSNVLDVLANDSSSPDTGETLKVSGVTQGNHGGSVTLGTGGTFIRYTPAVNFEGTETFNYTLSDGKGGTAQGNVTVTVTHVNHNPVATADTLTVSEDSATTNVNVLANDTDGVDSGETLTVIGVGTPNKGGIATLAADHLSVNYSPAANFQGTETFTYVLSDGNGGTATGTVTVTVTNVNDAPTATADTLTGFKNTSSVFNILANDISAPDPAEVLTVASVTQPSHGTLTITNSGTRVTYTPESGYTGPDSFSYTMQDAGGLTSSSTANITVQDFIPSQLGGQVFVDLNGNGELDGLESGVSNIEIKLTGTASGGQPVTVTTRTAADGSYLFENLAPGDYKLKQTQPAFLVDGADHAGTQGGSVSANDEITVHLNQNTTGLENNFTESGKPRMMTRLEEFFASNLGHNVLAAAAFPVVNGSGFGSAVSPAWQSIVGDQWSQFHNFKFALSGDSQNLRIDVRNAANQNLRATIPTSDTSLVLSLGESASGTLFKLVGDPADFHFTALPNITPVATSDSAAITAGTSTTINVVANDGDADGTVDFGSLTITQAPASGTAVPNSDGTITYTHNGGAGASDTFKYTVEDNLGGVSAVATVTIAINQRPTAVADSTTLAAGATKTFSLAANDTDSDGTISLTSIVITQQPAHGNVAVNTDGTVTYQHDNSAATTDTFSYKISDNQGAQSAAAGVVTIAIGSGEEDIVGGEADDVYFQAVDSVLAEEESWMI